MKFKKLVSIIILIAFNFLIFRDGIVYSQIQNDPQEIQLDGNPLCIAINPYTNQAVVGGILPSQVSIVDLSAKTVFSTLQVGKLPSGAAIDTNLNLAIISNTDDSTVSIINLGNQQVQKTISVGRAPIGVAVDEESHMALVANTLSNTVSVIDLQSQSLFKTISVGKKPLKIAVDPELKLAVVVNTIGKNLSIIDLQTYQVKKQIAMDRLPIDVSVNPETHFAAVSKTLDKNLTLVNLQTWQTSSFSVNSLPTDIAINPLDNSILVVCGLQKKLLQIDLNTHTQIESYDINLLSTDVAVNPFSNMAAVIDDHTDRVTLFQLPNPVPSITSIAPDTVLRGSKGAKITIEGSGFVQTSTVAALPVTFIDNHHLEVVLPESLFTGTGTYEITVTNPAPNGGSSNPASLKIVNPVPSLSALDPTQVLAGTEGLNLNIFGTGFFENTIASINETTRGFTLFDQTKMQIPLSSQDLEVGSNLDVSAFNPSPGGGYSNTLQFTVLNPVPTLSSIDPSSVSAGSSDLTLTLNGDNFVKTSTVSFSGQPVVSTYINKTKLQATIPGTAITTPGTFQVKVVNPVPGGGESPAVSFTANQSHPNVGPQPEGSFGEKYQDLIPIDATVQSYDPKRFSLITGLVKDLGNSPLADVSVSILNHSDYGTAKTNAEGRFSIPAEGGGTLTVVYQKAGFINTHRKVYVPWNDIAIAETIQMIAEDSKATALTFDGNPETVLTHRSTIVTDDRGSRSSTVVLTGDNHAYSVDASGNVIQELTTITTRATEFTTPDSMPAKLPPNSAYTYCVELGVDGAQRVKFDKPVVIWVDNFLGFNVGEAVPVGYYDRDRGVWVPSDNGKVVRLLDTNNDGIVDALDANGDGQPDDLNNNGSFSDEVIGLNDSQRYTPGSTFWRVEVTHFTPWDCNWPFGPPADAIDPNPNGTLSADHNRCNEDDCYNQGSVIEVRSRIFHEDIPIPGTDMTLHYASNRTKGFQQKITVPVSGAIVPASLKSIIVKMEIAGRKFEQTLSPLPNQTAEFIWDGRDYLGREIRTAATAFIDMGFVYDAVYLGAGNLERAFAQVGGDVTGIRARQEVTAWKRGSLLIHLAGKIGTIADGWTLSNHHSLNPAFPFMLYKGDGSIIKNDSNIISNLLKIPDAIFPGAQKVAIDDQGNLYTAGAKCFKIDTKGNVTHIAGTGLAGYSGDGGPATQAMLSSPYGIAVDPSGNIYIADTTNHRIRKVDTNGIITTIAGTGSYGYSGDGGPAVQARIYTPLDVEIDAQGNIYIADANNYRVRKIDSNGIITTIAQNVRPAGIGLDKLGNLYIANGSDYCCIKKLDTTGTITTIAGSCQYGSCGYSGDGGPATQAKLYFPRDVTADPFGNLYIADSGNIRIRKVDSSGIITTIAGTGDSGTSGIGGPAANAQLVQPKGVVLDGNNYPYIADWTRVLKISPPSIFADNMAAGDITFAEDNGLGHIFTYAGQHKSTIDLDTGRVLKTFGYDTKNNLISITDQFGNQTTIQRDANGVPTSITSPDGIITALTIDSNNHLARITCPATGSYNFEYTSGGLMTAKIEPEGNRFEHTVDLTGRLTTVSDQEGGQWQYLRTAYSNGDIKTDVLSAEGNLTSYLDHTDSTGAYTSKITDPTGAETLYARSSDELTATKSLPCGMNLTFKYGIDSQYKFKFVKEMREKTQSGLEKLTLFDKTYQDTNSDKIPDLITEKITLNGKLATLATNALQSKQTFTTPVGRTTTTFYDPNTLLATKLAIPGVYDTNFGYDAKGRLTSINTDIRQTTLSYDSQGNLYSMTDPENRTISYSYDAVGRMTGIHRPDTSSISFAYDKNGNMTALTNPATIDHGFDYNKVNLESSYKTPLSGSYSYLYNKDRQLTQINFPSGKQIKNIYDKERMVQTQTPDGNIDISYLCSDKVGSITKGSEIVTYGYDGSLVTSETLSGTLNQTLSFTYNNDFNSTSFTYAGSTTSYTYDNDFLLTKAGAFTIARNSGNGLPEAVTGGALNLTRTFNGYGDLGSQNFKVNSLSLTSYQVTPDKTGRIVNKAETVEGVTANYVYTYDPMGRLLTVTKDGSLAEEYHYDSVGRRNYETNVLKGISGKTYSYSDEDHLLTAGDTSYQFDADGFLTTKTQGTNITRYNYSSRGELLSANLPDGRLIEYINDSLGRRIAKKADGVIIEKYLWQGLTQLLAVYDGSDNLLMRFEYADARMPVSMTRAGVAYYLTYDQVGSLRIISDATGNVVKRIDYDSFGNIINDTNPGFAVPFGFAGGLHDRDTGLVRFGFRDYNPEIGRWTAKDPIRFAGEDIDLYGYVENNPINRIDPSGEIGSLPLILGGISAGILGYHIYKFIKHTKKACKEIDESRDAQKRFDEAWKRGDYEAAEQADQDYRDSINRGTKELGKMAVEGAQIEYGIGNKLPKYAVPKQ